MTPHPITITSLNGARNILSSDQAADYQALISIGHEPDYHEGEPRPVGFREFGQDGRQVKYRMNVPDLRFPDLRDAPTRQDIQALIDFFPQIQGAVLIHCYAGMSRSPAAALIYLAWALGKGCEAEAVVQLYDIKSTVTPNELMVVHGDRAMHRGRRLYDALLIRSGRHQYPEMRELYNGLRYDELGKFHDGDAT